MVQTVMDTATDKLFDDTDGLVGSECSTCSEYFFPQVSSCAHCSSEKIKRVALGTTAHLWSWTIQSFIPKPPYYSGETADTFSPYGVGLVQLNCGLIVKTRLRIGANKFAIGEPMSLEVVPFNSNGDGLSHTFQFRQCEDC